MDCRDQSDDLYSKLYTEVINELPNDLYQSSSNNDLQIYENYIRPSEIQLQGSAADGFLMYGLYRSDVDFLYPMKMFNSSLKLKNVISHLRSPGHVKIEIIPNISECKTDIEKDKLMANIEHIDGQCFLNLQQIKQDISERFYKRLKYFKECKATIKSETNSCFRIQLDYDYCKVMKTYMTRFIDILNDFSESILKSTELKENVNKLFSNLSGNYIVNEFKWKTFKEKINFSNEKNKTLQHEIINGLNYYLEKISDEMNQIIENECWQSNFFIINEYYFYFLLLILRKCGLNTIVEIICDKIIFVHHNNTRQENEFELVYFNEEEITKIINIDLNPILNEPITNQEKTIENIFYEFFKKIKIDLKNKIKDKNIDFIFKIFRIVRMEDLASKNKLHWLSTTIKLIARLLEYIQFIWCTSPQTQFLKINQGIEIVPGLHFTDWPLIASDWVKRERYWPEPKIIQRIINNGYHVVFKSLNENNGYDGRLSFSEAETIMCQAMTHDQIIIYNLIKDQLKSFGSEKLKSYYIKTLCFWVFESTPLDNNSTNKQQKYLQDIIKKLCNALKEQTLQHYFLPQHNLFIELKNEDFHEINECLRSKDPKFPHDEVEIRITGLLDFDFSVIQFFRLVENVFFKSISEIMK